MLEVNQTAQFKRDLKLCAKRRYDLQRLTTVVDTLRIPALLIVHIGSCKQGPWVIGNRIP